MTSYGHCADVTIEKEEVMYSGKWLSLKNITYRDQKGAERVWESLSRTTRHVNSADGVAVIATLKKSQQEDSLILVKQYRPPVKAFTIEFPAGLVDAGESPEQAAARELKEETGFTITTVKSISQPTCLDAGAEDSTISILCAEVNGDDPVNILPKANPVSQLASRISELTASGHVIDARVYTYSIALSSMTPTNS